MRVSLPFAALLIVLFGFPYVTHFVPPEYHPTITGMFITTFLVVYALTSFIVARVRSRSLLGYFALATGVLALMIAIMIPSMGGGVPIMGSIVTYLMGAIGGGAMTRVIVVIYDAVFTKHS